MTTIANQLDALPRRERRGSRARCVLLTDGGPAAVAEALSHLVEPFAVVDSARHTWMPRGFAAPSEARLGEAPLLLPKHHRELLTTWWLAVTSRANTPNWDIAATATIGGVEGLVLVEAKAHSNELKPDGHSVRNCENEKSIRGAIEEANAALNQTAGRWALTCDSHYQVANRFAWAWKLATLGVPVVLVYLGFLNASEMADRGDPFDHAEAWERAVQSHTRGVIPGGVWGRQLGVGAIPVIPLIRSLDAPLAMVSGAERGATADGG